jgi:glycine/D-amino acid oxidase-like deaminating enzyme
MGHLAVMDDSEAQFALTSFSQRLWRELAHELPPEAEYLPCGSLWVAADDEEMAEVRRKRAYYTARGIPVEEIDSCQLAEAEPHLRPGLAGGLIMPADAVCYPPCAAKYLLDRAVDAGGYLVMGRRVVSFDDSGATLDDGAFLPAGSIVIANGTAASDLVPGLVLSPRKGHLLITDRYPGFVNHQLIELGYLRNAHASDADSVAFNVQPRKTGQVLIGSSRQFGVTAGAVERDVLSAMLSRAAEYMPGIADLSAIRAWTGFRAATPDHLPVIGRAPGYRNVWLATGHEGLGISTSLATARLIADELLGRDSEIPRAPYDPARTPTFRSVTERRLPS